MAGIAADTTAIGIGTRRVNDHGRPGEAGLAPRLLLQGDEAIGGRRSREARNTMSTVQATSATAVQDLAKNLIKSFDANSDGQLGQEEFGSFLNQLMSGIQTASGTLTASPQTAGPGLQTLSKGALRRDLFEGFNFDREQNIEKSAKDAFASLASAAGAVPATKTEAEGWFNQNIKQGMESLGHKVDWVKGDKFQFSNWQGSWVVDFVRGADGPNPAFTWLADPAGASFT
jgi:hypothetical protein